MMLPLAVNIFTSFQFFDQENLLLLVNNPSENLAWGWEYSGTAILVASQ